MSWHAPSVNTGQPYTFIFHPHFEKQSFGPFLCFYLDPSAIYSFIYSLIQKKCIKCLLPAKFCSRLQGMQQQNNNNNKTIKTKLETEWSHLAQNLSQGLNWRAHTPGPVPFQAHGPHTEVAPVAHSVYQRSRQDGD